MTAPKVSNLPSKFSQKRAQKIADEGNKIITQIESSRMLLLKHCEEFTAHRADYETMRKAILDIENIILHEVKTRYTDTLKKLLGSEYPEEETSLSAPLDK